MFDFYLWPSRLEERLPLGEKRSLDIGNLVIPKWQTTREECGGKIICKEFENVIKYRESSTVENIMIRNTPLGGLISPRKGYLWC